DSWVQTGSQSKPTSVLLLYCIQINCSCVQFTCSQAPGTHLISVHNSQANEDVFSLLGSASSAPRIWLGGYRDGQSNKFIWKDGSVWDYQNWVPGQPSYTSHTENCVEMNWKSKSGYLQNTYWSIILILIIHIKEQIDVQAISSLDRNPLLKREVSEYCILNVSSGTSVVLWRNQIVCEIGITPLYSSAFNVISITVQSHSI
uniref:C-type lectin domain-containing protein n=1 Tax=Paramormyrops kingsleyae TaxID=1676925 RepID=A0A3B3SFD4_9TELE